MAGPLLILFTSVLLTEVNAIDYGECRSINNTRSEVINGTCFYLFKEISYWVQAYGICRENGLDLAYLQGQNIFTLFSGDAMEGMFWIYGGKGTPCKTLTVDPLQNKTIESKTRCTNNKEGFLCESGWEKVTETPMHADAVIFNTQTAVIITLACFVAIFLISLIIVIIVCKRPVIQRNILYDVSSTADGREAVYEEPRFDTEKSFKYDVATSAASTPLVYYEPKRTYSVKSSTSVSYEEPVTQKEKFKRLRNIWKFKLKGPEQKENDKETDYRLGKEQIQVVYQNEEGKGKGDEYLPMDSKTTQEPTDTGTVAGTVAEVYEPILYGNEK